MLNEIESLYFGIMFVGIAGLGTLWLLYHIAAYIVEEVLG